MQRTDRPLARLLLLLLTLLLLKFKYQELESSTELDQTYPLEP